MIQQKHFKLRLHSPAFLGDAQQSGVWRTPPTLLRDDTLLQTWRNLLEAAFDHAGKWLVFGAKTAVGYGRMKLDEEAIEEARDKKEQQAHALEPASLSPSLRHVAEFKEAFDAHAKRLLGRKDNPNTTFHDKARDLAREAAGWDGKEERIAAANAIEEWLPRVVRVDMKDERKQRKLSALRSLA